MKPFKVFLMIEKYLEDSLAPSERRFWGWASSVGARENWRLNFEQFNEEVILDITLDDGGALTVGSEDPKIFKFE